MTPEEAATLYDPMRRMVVSITSTAMKDVYPADMERAGRQLGIWKGGKLVVDADTDGFEMAMDVALMEPNPRGIRPYDRFLEKRAGSLPDDQRAMADRMKGAWFSVFRMKEKHPAGGISMIDLINGDRELWMMDRSLGETAKPGMALGMRLFDAGPFHMGFGQVSVLNDMVLMMVQTAAKGGWSKAFHVPMSALLYGQTLGTGREFTNAMGRVMHRMKHLARGSNNPTDGATDDRD